MAQKESFEKKTKFMEETMCSTLYSSVGKNNEPVVLKIIRNPTSHNKKIFDNEMALLKEFQALNQKNASCDFFVPLLAATTHPWPMMTLKKGWIDLHNFYRTTGLSRYKRCFAVAFHIKKIFQHLLQMHKMGYAHNDIKPENVVIMFNSECDYQKQIFSEDPDDFRKHNLKLIDFGFSLKIKEENNGQDLNSKEHENDSWLNGITFGTPCYMHPDVAAKRTICCKTNDYFALGLTTFCLYADMDVFPQPDNPTHCAQVHLQFCNGTWMHNYALDHLHELPLFHLWISFVSLLCGPHAAKLASTTILHHDFIQGVFEEEIKK